MTAVAGEASGPVSEPASPPSAHRRLFADVRRHQGGPLAVAGLLMLVGALLEGLGLLSLLPLLAFATGRAAVPSWLGWQGSQDQLFVVLLAAFVIAMAARSLILLARDRASARLEADYDVSLRLRAAATLAARGWSFAAGVGQGGMQTMLANEVPRCLVALHFGLAAATAAFVLLIQLIVAAALSPAMAAGALGLIALGLPALVALSRRSQDGGQKIVAGQADSADATVGFYAGLKAALAQERVGEFLASYDAILGRLRGYMLRYQADMAVSRARHGIAAAVAAAVVIGAGHALHLELARLITLLVLFARMSSPAQALQQSLVGVAAFGGSFDAIEQRLGGLIDRPAHEQAGEPLEWDRAELDAVSFQRATGAGLSPFTDTLQRGEWIALVGASGAGKTTLIDVVATLLAPTEGELRVDGRPLDGERLRAWRRGLAYVGQQESPFEPTVRQALGGAPEEQCWAILDLVGLADIVRQSQRGLDLPLEDRGARLSGGERQRLLIARALLRQPRLLLMDEATAALDVESERRLVEAIRTARPRLATLLVAHRAETVAMCDRTWAIGAAP